MEGLRYFGNDSSYIYIANDQDSVPYILPNKWIDTYHISTVVVSGLISSKSHYSIYT